MSRSHFVGIVCLLAATCVLAGPRISLVQGYTFDPIEEGVPALPAELTIDGYDAEYGYHVIQFPGPVLPEWKREVERLGVDLLWYLPQYAFIARVPTDRRQQVEALADVRWVGLFQPAYKLFPGLEKARGSQELIVVFFYDENEYRLTGELRDIGAWGIATDFNPWNKSVKVNIDGDRIADIARLPGVFWVEPFGEITPDNIDVQWVDQHGYSVSDTTRTIWHKGVYGRNVTVGITDSPLWMNHDQFRDTINNTPSINHRKVVRYVGTQGADQHGTHTTGTLCGSDDEAGGSSWYDGLCKGSKVIFQNYAALSGNWDMNNWLARPESGVGSYRAWNHSMSLSRKDSFNLYVFTDMTADQFIWNHKRFMHCNSMGNRDSNEMGHPVNAKNIISTGAAGNGVSCRSFATYSSRGPTSDGRRKPQLVSPGSVVYSASHTNASGYVSLSGTSMATPNMTAATALIREYFRMGFYPTGDTSTGTPREISAALNKAVAVVGADKDMTGYTVPDNNIGWGRVDLDSSLYFVGDSSKLWVADDTNGLTTGDSMVYSVGVSSNSRPFRVALCWSDYPGTMQASYILVNDLDLTVTSPTGIEYKGNVWSGGQSQTGGIYDTLNVEECFRLNSPQVGNWQIKVKARNAPQGPQPFAVAAIGAFGTVIIHDVGVSRLLAPTGAVDSGAVVTPACSVYNYGNQSETYTVRMRIGTLYNQAITVSSHTPLTAQYISFPNWTAVERGVNAVRCTTELVNDVDRSNDRALDSVLVRIRDVGATRIVVPTGTVDSGVSVTPACSVYNYGSTLESYDVEMRIGSGYSSTVGVSNHLPGTRMYVTFTSWTPGQRGTFQVSCSTRLAADLYHSNDKITDSVVVRVRDVGVTYLLAPSGTLDSGAVVTPACSVFNYGSEAAGYQVRMRIGSFYNQVLTISGHAVGTNRYIAFPDWTALQRGIHPVTCSTQLYMDVDNSNDRKTGTVAVRVIDVGATRVMAPVGAVDSGVPVTPACSVYNHGNTVETYPVRMRISTGYDTTVTVSGHPAGSAAYVTFPAWTPVTRGVFAVGCSTELVTDMDHANDKATDTVLVRVVDAEAVSISVPSGSYARNSTITPRATWRNNSNLPITFQAWMILTDPTLGRVYAESIDVVGLGAGLDTTVGSFPVWTLGSSGTWSVRCSTWLEDDAIAGNNIIDDRFLVSDPDLGVVRILSPASRVDTGATVTPEAMVRNFGPVDVGYLVWFIINNPGGAEVYRQMLAVASIAPGDSVVHTFPDFNVGNFEGGWAVRCSLFTFDDGDSTNDFLDGSFKVTTLPAWPEGWHEVASMPLLPSGKPVKRGGWLALDAGEEIVYAAKGYKTPDVYYYVPRFDNWVQVVPIPDGREAKPPRKGAKGICDGRGVVYATKGNNTPGFWKYDATAGEWTQLADVPLGPSRKKVKGGTDMIYAPDFGGSGREFVYLLKGYRSEFYRYDVAADSWGQLEDAPTGHRAKWDKGSWLVHDGYGSVYAHKAKYHELWRYDLRTLEWDSLQLPGMPFIGSTGRKKKSKDGGSAAWYDGLIYALKGGNTQEFWMYDPEIEVWTETDTFPAFGSTGRKKRVKQGADLVSFGAGAFFALKGNKTVEMWRYVLPMAAGPNRVLRSGVTSENRLGVADYGLQIVPNPLGQGPAAIRYSLPRPGPVAVDVFDIAGRTVLSRSLLAGRSGTLSLDTRRLVAGVYLVRLDAAGLSVTRKLVVER